MTPTETTLSPDQAAAVKERARRLGFDLAAFSSVEVPLEDRDFFMEWCARGMGADMAWLSRDPARRADPRAFHPDALGVLVLGVSYFQGPVPPAPAAPAGRVARYAWGRDYHEVITARLGALEEALHEILGPGLALRRGLDAQPLLERSLARRSGLGFVGKNTNIIAPRMGSWIFLTEILINRALPEDSPARQGCGGCTACQDKCPTGALDQAFQLDARLCISYHTIENRGPIPRPLREKMGVWLFGCDDCQDVCPFNARAKETQWPEFSARHGVGAWLSLTEIMALRTPAAFKGRFSGTPLLRAKRAGILRNACVVAGNLRAGDLIGPLEECLNHDPDPLVRGHAAWALGRLSAPRALDAAWTRETDAFVREEISHALQLSALRA